MGHGHTHGHGHHHHHGHDHDHSHDAAAVLPAAFDPAVPDEALTPEQQSRRTLLRRAGLLGAGLAAASVVAPAAAAAAPASAASSAPASGGRRSNGFLWLSGDHHIHTQYSSDGKYRVVDQVRQGAKHGMDWLVITDHGSTTHAKIGVDKVNPDIRAARAAYEDTLVFQGLEWNIPGAEHGTVFVHPGNNEVSVLKQFETDYDGSVKNASDSTPANEALAVAGLNFLAEQVQRRKVKDALMLANHPARRGVDSPHEIRNWRDAGHGRQIAIGFEGAPGHQAAGLPAPMGPGRARGIYDNNPSANSFAGYPLESYRTWGGFDWMTATVGGPGTASSPRASRGGSPPTPTPTRSTPTPPRAAPGATSRPTAATPTRSTAARSTSPRATTGPASTAVRTSAPTASPTPPSWTASAPAASGSTTASCSAPSTSGSAAVTAGPRSAARCTCARAPMSR